MTNTLRSSGQGTSQSCTSSDRSRRRQLAVAAAVGLSAVASVPVFAELTASPMPAAPHAAAIAAMMQVDAPAAGSSGTALTQGKEQLAAKQYEEALATLQQAKPDELADAGQRADLDSSLKMATEATAQRRAARAAFEQGEKSLAAGDKWGAIGQYAAAKDNQYADAATAEKANTQIALAVNELGDLKDVYSGAKSDFDAGNLDTAKAKFVALNAVGYKAGLLNKSPADYIAMVDQKQMTPAAGTAAGTTAEATAAADAAAAPAGADAMAMMTPAQKARDARMAYVAGRDAYHRGDVATAKESFQKAVDLNYKKGFGEAGPQKMLAEIDQKEQADVARMARANRTADATAVASAAATPDAIPQSTPAADAPAMDKPATDKPADTTTPAAMATPAASPDLSGQAVAQATPAQSMTPTTEMTPAAAPTPGDTVTPAPMAAPAAAPTMATADAMPATMPAADNSLRAAADADKIRNAQNMFQAKQLVEKADQARSGQRLDDSLALYDSALKLDPSNQQAQQGKSELQKLKGIEPGKTDPLTDYTHVIEAKQQTISFSVQAALEEARMTTADGDYAGARRALIRAQSARDSDPGIFPAEKLAAFDSGIRSQTSATDRAEAAKVASDKQKASQEAIDAQNNAATKLDEQRRSTITALIKQSRQLTQQGRNDDALKIIDQIITIDPRNDYALGVRPLIYDRIQLGRQRKSQEDINRNIVDVLNMAEESRIPIPDLLTYPTDWPDLAARRDATTARERGGETDQATEAILAKQLPELRFDGVPFTDVVDFLRDTTQANIFVNWTAIEGAGVDKNAPITTRLTNVKFAKVLAIILDSAGGGVARLGYTIDDGVITISTQDDLAKNVQTRTYDIRDLLINVQDFQGADVQAQQDSGGDAEGGSSQGLFGGGGANNNSNNEQDRTARVEQITQLITDTIASDSWKVNGGLIGAVQELSGQLIVTQTPENQSSILHLLEQLRETRAIQVNVEARFLTVQRNFLEEVGVDFDFQFNGHYTGARDLTPDFTNSTQVSPITVSQNSVTSGTGGFTGPGNLVGTGVNTNLGSEAQAGAYGLSTGVNAFLDDFRASLFLRAVQLGQNATTLTAPKLTLFNGQRAYIRVQTTQAYVSSLTPIVANGAVGYTARIRTAPTGIQLDVQATVSADRKYVTMTVIPSLQRLVRLTTFSYASGQQTVTNGNGTNGSVTDVTTQVQLPQQETTTLSTTVSVPDRGTLLLGGQTLMGEIERESGVPVLSKIPFLKRLFTNRGTAKDEQILLILIKPTIIIQREVEQTSFPLLEAGQ